MEIDIRKKRLVIRKKLIVIRKNEGLIRIFYIKKEKST